MYATFGETHRFRIEPFKEPGHLDGQQHLVTGALAAVQYYSSIVLFTMLGKLSASSFICLLDGNSCHYMPLIE